MEEFTRMQLFRSLTQKYLMIQEFLNFKKQCFLPDNRNIYLWCGREVYHGLQSWSLASQKNGLNDHCSISWFCSSCTLSNFTGTTQICANAKIFPIAKIAKSKTISYSAFHTIGLNADICLDALQCEFSSVFGARIVLATTEKKCYRVVQKRFAKISYQWLSLFHAPLSRSFIPLFSSQKPWKSCHEAPPFQFQHYI